MGTPGSSVHRAQMSPWLHISELHGFSRNFKTIPSKLHLLKIRCWLVIGNIYPVETLTLRTKGKHLFGQQITRNPLYVNGRILSLTCQIRQLNNSVSLQGRCWISCHNKDPSVWQKWIHLLLQYCKQFLLFHSNKLFFTLLIVEGISVSIRFTKPPIHKHFLCYSPNNYTTFRRRVPYTAWNTDSKNS